MVEKFNIFQQLEWNVIKMKIKELRLLNLTIKKDGNTIYEGKAEDVPNDLKEENYKNIYFEGVDVIIEI